MVLLGIEIHTDAGILFIQYLQLPYVPIHVLLGRKSLHGVHFEIVFAGNS